MARRALCLGVLTVSIAACVEGDPAAPGDTEIDLDAEVVTESPDAAPDTPAPAPDAAPAPPDAAPEPSLQMVLVPAGPFWMGCAQGDNTCRFDAYPGRTVELSAFEIDVHETTQAEWAACVEAGACPLPQAHYTPEATPRAAVRNITWAQAAAYCAWRGARLPTEAEWEKAARGADARHFPWGEDAPTCETAAFKPCNQDPVVGMHPTGATPLAIEDLAGGVWEFTADWYASSYAGLPSTDPTGPASGAMRVMRGGGFRSDAWALRADTRVVADPALNYDDAGFRCARTP
jgi:formylglycine-generating enzyme required for sulfatase activity